MRSIPPFRKILVANRGEIATRVMQTCEEMGIGTVAVFSTADRSALHVQRADEAFEIGPPPAAESYLNMDAILRAARQSGVDAIHPGYGFLAENPEFARKVEADGLVWIGPSSDVIGLMGDKIRSKELATLAGIRTIPGYYGDDESTERILSEARIIGYPVMIKAASGGGGKGMRTVMTDEELRDALEGARREARAAFGDERVFLEKQLSHPRHIEMQIVADRVGNAIYLGERDCSVQRRHQKVLEESPSPVLTRDLRTRMGEDALRMVRSTGYTSVGTIEYLFEADSYYFLEMNTRIQVEHPVTEMVTGLDLVRLQIEIAAGYPLSLAQLDVESRGHAIECRLYAEDPQNDFLPASGRLDVIRFPEGAGIRNDVGVFPGADVPPYYDPILAKLIVHAENRNGAISRMENALERYQALGIRTNLEFLHWVVTHPEFRSGRVSTDFVDRFWSPAEGAEVPADVLIAGACYEALDALQGVHDARSSEDAYNPWSSSGSWRTGGSSQTFGYEHGERHFSVSLNRGAGETWAATVDGTTRLVEAELFAAGALLVREGTRVTTFAVVRTLDEVTVQWRGIAYSLKRRRRELGQPHGGHVAVNAAGIAAPMPGIVVKVAVKPGQQVVTHQPLLVLEAMKMEHVIDAPYDAIVREILFKEGELVPSGAPVVQLEAL